MSRKASDCTIQRPKCDETKRKHHHRDVSPKPKKHTLKPEHLLTGFGLHSLSSLELAIMKSQQPKVICKCPECVMYRRLDTRGEGEGSDRSTMVGGVTYGLQEKQKLMYLMGLSDGEEEGQGEEFKGKIGLLEGEDLINGGTEAMRRAQRYLREHRIFEFFQFLIAHLLAAVPYDPIEFLINLLDKCLIYRAGVGDPPLLYDREHINCLFNLMDRMRTGFIDLNQYKTGMLTFGIKSFNPHPPVTEDNMVPRTIFCDEAYECLKDLLNDMIRRRPKAKEKKKHRHHAQLKVT